MLGVAYPALLQTGRWRVSGVVRYHNGGVLTISQVA